MLDQAGLSNVPVGNLYSGTDSNMNWCQTANLNTYNASTPQASTGFPTSASVVRTVMAKNPTTPVIIYNGPAPANYWLYDFLQSPADSISSLTGQQLWDQDVANGGAMWWQGAPSCYPSSYPSPTPCSGSWTTLDATGIAVCIQPPRRDANLSGGGHATGLWAGHGLYAHRQGPDVSGVRRGGWQLRPRGMGTICPGVAVYQLFHQRRCRGLQQRRHGLRQPDPLHLNRRRRKLRGQRHYDRLGRRSQRN